MDSFDRYAQLILSLYEQMAAARAQGGLRTAASRPDVQWLSEEAGRFGLAAGDGSVILSLGATLTVGVTPGFLAAVNAARSMKLITRQTAREARRARARSRRLRTSTRSLRTHRMADRLLG